MASSFYIPLTAGAYQSRSLTAAAQRCVNLYVEPTPQNTNEPLPATHYCTPGSTLLRNAPQAIIRGLYRATNGNLYGCAGQSMYYIDEKWFWYLLGSFQATALSNCTPRTTPVGMSDNGSVLLICDGSPAGYFIDLTKPTASQTLTLIDTNISPGFLGSDFITYLDTYFVCNSPGTDIFYVSVSDPDADTFISASTVLAATVVNGGTNYVVGDVLNVIGTGTGNSTEQAQITVQGVDSAGVITSQAVTSGGVVLTEPIPPVSVTGGTGSGATFTLDYGTGTGAFDPLDFAAKSGMADNLVAAIAVHRVLWCIGTSSFEIWIDTGGSGTITNNFPFQILPGAYENFGCAAKYSIATIANQIFWLQADQYGHGFIVKGEGISATRVSTFAIESAINSYPVISDAIGMTYQADGHQFYMISFPSASDYNGVTWCFDASTNEWHERTWNDTNGIEHRHRANCVAEAYGKIVAGDWENENFFELDLNNGTDFGNPIVRTRSFPHSLDAQGNKRISYNRLIANMQVGMASTTPPQTLIDCTFHAPNGTLLQDYEYSNDIGAEFTKISDDVDAEVMSYGVVATGNGSLTYMPSGQPSTPDYTITFNAGPVSYSSDPPPDGAFLFVVGRADIDGNGYLAGVSSDGTQCYANLGVMPADPMTVAMGNITSGYFSLVLSMQSTAINLSVWRSEDGNWLQPDGSWYGSQSIALSIEDSTYAVPGEILGPCGTWT